MGVHVERRQFEKWVREALDELPASFRPYLKGLEVRVEDYPQEELMEAWGLTPPDYPFGIYDGPSLPDVDDRDGFDGIIVLYRRPMEEWSRTEHELRDQIRRTVYHELGHRLGFPEEEMPDALRGGVGGRWASDALRNEASRFLRQARHDAAAARCLLNEGACDWALDAALSAAERGLRAALMAGGHDPDALTEDGIGELLGRLISDDRGWRDYRAFVRLDRVNTGMGAASLPTPAERVRRRVAAEAVDLADRLLESISREVDR